MPSGLASSWDVGLGMFALAESVVHPGCMTQCFVICPSVRLEDPEGPLGLLLAVACNALAVNFVVHSLQVHSARCSCTLHAVCLAV